jgi:hypothetical protein
MGYRPAEFAHLRQRGQQRPPQTAPVRRGMNGTEAAYAAHLGMRQLAGEIVGWKYEAVKLRLADGAFYKPDFLVILPGGAIELHETKGHWREAARVRFKVARELFAPIVFRAIRKGEGGFYEEQV